MAFYFRRRHFGGYRRRSGGYYRPRYGGYRPRYRGRRNRSYGRRRGNFRGKGRKKGYNPNRYHRMKIGDSDYTCNILKHIYNKYVKWAHQLLKHRVAHHKNGKKYPTAQYKKLSQSLVEQMVKHNVYDAFILHKQADTINFLGKHVQMQHLGSNKGAQDNNKKGGVMTKITSGIKSAEHLASRAEHAALGLGIF